MCGLLCSDSKRIKSLSHGCLTSMQPPGYQTCVDKCLCHRKKKWSNACKGCRFATVDCFLVAPALVFMPEHGPRILSSFFFFFFFYCLLHYSTSFVSITQVNTLANISSRHNHTLSQEESSDGSWISCSSGNANNVHEEEGRAVIYWLFVFGVLPG